MLFYFLDRQCRAVDFSVVVFSFYVVVAYFRTRELGIFLFGLFLFLVFMS